MGYKNIHDIIIWGEGEAHEEAQRDQYMKMHALLWEEKCLELRWLKVCPKDEEATIYGTCIYKPRHEPDLHKIWGNHKYVNAWEPCSCDAFCWHSQLSFAICPTLLEHIYTIAQIDEWWPRLALAWGSGLFLKWLSCPLLKQLPKSSVNLVTNLIVPAILFSVTEVLNYRPW